MQRHSDKCQSFVVVLISNLSYWLQLYLRPLNSALFLLLFEQNNMTIFQQGFSFKDKIWVIFANTNNQYICRAQMFQKRCWLVLFLYKGHMYLTNKNEVLILTLHSVFPLFSPFDVHRYHFYLDLPHRLWSFRVWSIHWQWREWETNVRVVRFVQRSENARSDPPIWCIFNDDYEFIENYLFHTHLGPKPVFLDK